MTYHSNPKYWDRQTVQPQIRCHRMQHLIRDLHCLQLISTVLDTLVGSQNLGQVWYGVKVSQYLELFHL